MKVLLFVLAMSLLTSFCYAQSVTVNGEVTKPLTLTAAQIAALPRTQVTANDKQGMPHVYNGVALAELFKEAGVTTGKQLRGPNMAKYVLVSCADNYKVVFSLAELDSSFTDRVVILADTMDGKPLATDAGPFRVVVPGEKKPARNAFKVTAITIKTATE